jgi:hypothetical protein
MPRVDTTHKTKSRVTQAQQRCLVAVRGSASERSWPKRAYVSVMRKGRHLRASYRHSPVDMHTLYHRQQWDGREALRVTN